MSKPLLIAALGVLALGTSACDVKKTEDGEMPDVKVEGGKLPEYKVDAPEVNVKTEKKTVEVPTVEVTPADADKKD